MVQKGGRQDWDEWMHVAMVMTLHSNNQQAHVLIYYCHLDYLVCCDNIGHVPVDC